MRTVPPSGSISAVALLVSLAAPLAAQGPATVSPKMATTGLGNSNNNFPFSWSPSCYQQVHDVALFSSTAPKVVMQMSLRMGQGFTNRAGHTIDVELWMAEAAVPSMSASASFASNTKPMTEVNVLLRKMVNLPLVPNNNWAVTFPFDNPFVFTGASDVCWRANVWGNSNNNASFTYPLDAWWHIGNNARQGSYAGCQSASGTKKAEQTATALTLRTGQTPTFTGKSFVTAGGLPAFLTIGASGTAYQGLPLPFDLTPLGAPGCMITNDVLATIAGVTAAGTDGPAAIQLPIPLDPALEGGTFYTQFLFLEAGANPLGLFSSFGLRNTIGVTVGMTRIYGIGNPGGTSGTLDRGFGMAIELN